MGGNVEGDDDTMPGEEEMDQPAEQRLQSGADNEDLINTKTRVRRVHHCILPSHGW